MIANLNIVDIFLCREQGLFDAVTEFAFCLSERIEVKKEEWKTTKSHVLLEAHYETGRGYLKANGFGSPVLIQCRVFDGTSDRAVITTNVLIYRKADEVFVGVDVGKEPVSDIQGNQTSVAKNLVESILGTLFPPDKA